MRGKLWFLGGMAAGFVLGARAGREKYEELVRTTQKIKDSPTVQEATGVVREQATKLYSESRSKVADKVAHSRLSETRLGQRLTSAADTDAGARSIARAEAAGDTLSATTPVAATETRSPGA